jgi:predicted O-methyltransferase YrrM
MIDAPSHYEEIAPDLTEQQRHLGYLKQQAFTYMAQLHGWCSHEAASFFIDLIFKTKPHVIVEIGVWGGKSLVPMALALKANQQGIIYGIDPWSSSDSVQWVMEEVNRDFWSRADHDWVYRDLQQKLTQFDLQAEVKIIRATSEDAPPIHGIDILHIDGNHSDPASYLDVTKWVPLVKSGGWIIFDDMRWFENGMFTTARAEQWLNANCYKLAEFTDICTWGVWIKP